ncbi:MAG: HEAT repeat domain-containing protein [Phycisphaerae bacterium]|nr:HEAT repeat domain-containing protein [Phycisphaerae bacterium]
MRVFDEFWSAVAIARAVRAWGAAWPSDVPALPVDRALVATIERHRTSADAHERLAAVELIGALGLPGFDDWLAQAGADADAEVRACARGLARSCPNGPGLPEARIGNEVSKGPEGPGGLPSESAFCLLPSASSLGPDERWRVTLADPDRDTAEWGRVLLEAIEETPDAVVARLGDGVCHSRAVVRELAAMLMQRVPPTASNAWRTVRHWLCTRQRLDAERGTEAVPLSPMLLQQAAARLITPDGQLDELMLAVLLHDVDVLSRSSLESLGAGELQQLVGILRSRGAGGAIIEALDAHRVQREMVERLAVENLAHYVRTPLHTSTSLQASAARAAVEVCRRLLAALAEHPDARDWLRQVGVDSPPIHPPPEAGFPAPPDDEAAATAALADADPLHRCEAVWALARTRDTAAVTALSRRLGEADAVVRQAVVDTLAATPRPEALLALLRRSGDARASVRRALADVLAAWALPEAAPTLCGLLEDKDAETVVAAMTALRRLHLRGALQPAEADRFTAAVQAWRSAPSA